MQNIHFRYIVQWGPGYGENVGFVRHNQAVHFAYERSKRYPTRIIDDNHQRVIWEHSPSRQELHQEPITRTIWDGEAA